MSDGDDIGLYSKLVVKGGKTNQLVCEVQIMNDTGILIEALALLTLQC